jgi:hypothetical protein
MRNQLRAAYSVRRVTPDRVFIVDDYNDASPTMSVTNNAEAVVEDVNQTFPNRRIIYRDTEGRWDELKHNNGVFVNFAPYNEELP